jgi:L-type amino acid transporter 9
MEIILFLMPILHAIHIIFIGYTEHLETGFEDTTESVSMVALAFYDGLWAYDGWYVFF